jgi:tetraacyldisaccharide 4'-kinase
MFLLYNLALALASLLLVPYYLLKGKYRGTLAPRWGRLEPSLQQTGNRSIWLHAVSVGEVLSCQELLARLRVRFPGVKILVSTTTPAGQRMAQEKLVSLADGIFYAPLDVPFAVRRTLRSIRPRLVIILETEIWPNLYREVKRWGAGLLVVNGRISDASAPSYRRFRFFFGRVLRLADSILAQSPLDRQRFLEAGAPPETVETVGNLKFDAPAPVAAVGPVAEWIDRVRPQAVVLAGSTRETEESQVLQVFRELSQKFERLLLVLAPRHPQRFGEVAQLLAAEGWRFVRRSELPGASCPALPAVLLLDTLGELGSLYPRADVVFVGGSLMNWGGHNVLEPAMAGKPIVVGPHMQNFRAIADVLLAARGMIQVEDAKELGPALARLLERPEEAADLGARARRAVEMHRGATARAVDRAELLYHRAVPSPRPTGPQRWLLWLPARVWEAAARIRNHAYQQGWLTTQRLDTFTVSVGNLTAGGTGKTPLVWWLLEHLQEHGTRCAVLSRGYRRQKPEPVTILRVTDEAPVEVTGDEIQLLRRRFRVSVGIAADRVAAGRELIARFHPEVLILDDGFQHRRLERDLDIVLIDVTDPFGRRELLPLGRLREPLAALARADAIVLNRVAAGERWEGLQQELRRHNLTAPIFLARFEPEAVVRASNGEERPVEWLAGRRVAAFAGIGNPDAFFDAVSQTGAILVQRLAFPDHHRYQGAGPVKPADAELLITTEKDLVNLDGYDPPDLYWFKTRLVVEQGERLLGPILRPDREGALR